MTDSYDHVAFNVPVHGRASDLQICYSIRTVNRDLFVIGEWWNKRVHRWCNFRAKLRRDGTFLLKIGDECYRFIHS